MLINNQCLNYEPKTHIRYNNLLVFDIIDERLTGTTSGPSTGHKLWLLRWRGCHGSINSVSSNRVTCMNLEKKKSESNKLNQRKLTQHQNITHAEKNKDTIQTTQTRYLNCCCKIKICQLVHAKNKQNEKRSSADPILQKNPQSKQILREINAKTKNKLQSYYGSINSKKKNRNAYFDCVTGHDLWKNIRSLKNPDSSAHSRSNSINCN